MDAGGWKESKKQSEEEKRKEGCRVGLTSAPTDRVWDEWRNGLKEERKSRMEEEMKETRKERKNKQRSERKKK